MAFMLRQFLVPLGVHLAPPTSVQWAAKDSAHLAHGFIASAAISVRVAA
ncbi:MAG: hypothetical protein ACI9M6_001418 [Hydrogenophaga sp.]|jgi:hypothetical protein